MRIRIEVLRRSSGQAEAHWQSFLYETQGEGETVATALTRLGQETDLRDADGGPAAPIQWEHSCLQKKCGACAMVIDGRPRLACDARLSEYRDVVRLEPLRKFPVVADLIVDRTVLFDNLTRLNLWLEEHLEQTPAETATAFSASRCLQCGCCLEICPNFSPDGRFTGAAGAVPASRILEELDAPGRSALAKQYRRRVFEGCGKSLACQNVCPAEIDVERLMSKSNAAAVWRLRRKKGAK